MSETGHPQPPPNEPRLPGRGAGYVIWILVLAGLTLFFSRWVDRQHNPNQQVSSVRGPDYVEVVLQRNRQGHYVAAGRINDQDVVFMLDTGATKVAVPQALASRLGLERGAEFPVITANGTIMAHATRLQSVQLGEIELQNVSASINPRMHGEEVLLGMSFLKHLEFSQRGDSLTIRQHRQP